jgi:SAM-dependent methyltransferase
MSLRRNVLRSTNRVLNTFNMHLLPIHEYNSMRQAYRGSDYESPPIPPEAQRDLTWDNPALLDLEKRYASQPASVHAVWSKSELKESVDLARFRADNHYVHQTRWSPSDAAYYMTAAYIRDTDKLGLFGRLKEDGLFGAYCLEFDGGYTISRDLLDSINEANAISRFLGRSPGEPLRLLDIGAGYGRLAYRLSEGWNGAHVTCADAVPLSSFLSDFYLKFRGVTNRTSVVPLDQAKERLKGASFDLVTNIHSFSECPLRATVWWLDLLEDVDVKKLLLVPNGEHNFRSSERNGGHLDFRPEFAKRGWKLTHSESIYAGSAIAQRCALYPKEKFHLFER